MQRVALHTSNDTIALTFDAAKVEVESIYFALARRVISSAFFLESGSISSSSLSEELLASINVLHFYGVNK